MLAIGPPEGIYIESQIYKNDFIIHRGFQRQDFPLRRKLILFVISWFPVTEITHGFGNFRSPVFAFVHIFVFGSPVFAYVCISMWVPVFAHIFVFEVAQPVVEYSEVCTLSTENSGWVIARKTYMLREAISESISFMRQQPTFPVVQIHTKSTWNSGQICHNNVCIHSLATG